MAEYIEREALIRKIRHFAADVIFRGCKVIMTDEESCNPVEWTKGYEQGVKDAANLIVGQPTADVVPVMHGRWEFDGSDWSDIWKCSACGDEWFFEYDPRDEETLVKYCPNCGARMDGEG